MDKQAEQHMDDAPIQRRGSSLIMRFATSTGLLALGVVILAIIFFHTIRGDIFQGAFQAPLKEWSATVAGHIGSDISRAQVVAKNHQIGLIFTNADGRFAFGPDGEPVDPDELLENASRFRQIDIHVQHAGQAHQLQYSFMLDKEQFDDDRSALLLGLIFLLLFIIGLAYAMQASLLRPLKWLRSGVDSVSEGDFSTRVPVVRNDEIGKVARAFNQMTNRVQQMMDDRERLLADVSHELRSPLARIKVALELLPEGDKRDSISQDISEMEALTTALLEREQIRNRAGQAKLQVINLVVLAGEVIDGFSDRTPGVELNVPPQELEITGDAALIKVLIHNLVDNALKFSLADSKAVEVMLNQTENGVQLIVGDDGQGIPEDQAEKVFEPFVKLNPARGHRTGYGLGLNLCQRIVQAQGGSIEIQAREERGIRVLVTFASER
ncbi:MAG: HAMP domain-containing protein [Gammaproteobacteria bacterium]|nr:HAMP domain-containing protein [Gammaproteobacteria bacterium]